MEQQIPRRKGALGHGRMWSVTQGGGVQDDEDDDDEPSQDGEDEGWEEENDYASDESMDYPLGYEVRAKVYREGVIVCACVCARAWVPVLACTRQAWRGHTFWHSLTVMTLLLRACVWADTPSLRIVSVAVNCDCCWFTLSLYSARYNAICAVGIGVGRPV